MEAWLIIYRGYTDAELAKEISWLREQTRNPYSAQTEGQRSYARSTGEIRDRLAAATQAQRERTPTTESRHGYADFSRVQVR